MRRLVLVLIALALPTLAATPARAQQVAWQQWQHQPGIVDVGARADGTLVAMAAGQLYLVSTTTTTVAPFSTGPGGFSADPNAEPYFVVTSALTADGNRCS